MELRVFKTSWFATEAKKARIPDAALLLAIQQVELGQADNLGGGVFKKRLNENRHRSIILARAGRFWVYAYLFAKQDKANIEPDELAAFRKLAELYRKKSEIELAKELEIGVLLVILR